MNSPVSKKQRKHARKCLCPSCRAVLLYHETWKIVEARRQKEIDKGGEVDPESYLPKIAALEMVLSAGFMTGVTSINPVQALGLFAEGMSQASDGDVKAAVMKMFDLFDDEEQDAEPKPAPVH